MLRTLKISVITNGRVIKKKIAIVHWKIEPTRKKSNGYLYFLRRSSLEEDSELNELFCCIFEGAKGGNKYRNSSVHVSGNVFSIL